MRGFKIILFSSALFLALTTASVFSYDNVSVHPRLTETAVNLFEQAGQKLTGEQKNLIIQGSVEEDVAPRYLNHFYNPTTGKGLTGLFFGKSAKEWAQKQDSVTGDYSETAILNNYRQGNLIVAYKGIGHILHLIQDMAVPAHVRNDPHADGDPYEKWAKQYGVIGQKFKNIPISNLNSVFDDLASFTHDNFLSKDSLELNKNKKYYIKEDVDNNKKTTYLFSNINGIDTKISLVDTTSILPIYYINTDKKLHQDYWSQLHPQAIGYSSGAIEYFLKKFAEIDNEKKPVNLSLWNRLQNFASLYISAMEGGVSGYASVMDVSSQESKSDVNSPKGYFESAQYGQTVSKQFLDMLAQSVSAAVKPNPPKSKVLGVKEAKPATVDQILNPITTPMAVPAIRINPINDTPAPTSIITEPEVIPKTNNNFQFIFTSPNNGSSPLAQMNLDPIVLPVAEIGNTPTSSEIISSSSEEIVIATSSPADITPPTVEIINGPEANSSSTAADFLFSSNKAEAIFSCRLDASDWQACLATSTFENLGEGGHELEISAEDKQGNISATTAGYSWIVDMTAPTSSLDALSAEYEAVGFAVGWSGNDSSSASTTSGLAGFDIQYKIATGDWQGWMNNASSVTAVFDLPVQNKTDVYFRIRARDQAGNLSVWSEEVKTILDDGIADHLVINEIEISGETVKDEFVELYNPTDAAISLAGYQLKRKSLTGVEYNLLSDFGAEEVPAKGHFLITHPTGYAGSTTADLVYSSASYSLAASNTVILYNGTTTVDKLGFGGAADAETAAFPNNPDSGQSLERKINGYDSDDNGADFIIRDIPDPRNSGVDRTPIAPAEIPDITVDSISSGFNTKYLKTFSLSHTVAGQDELLVVNIHSDGDYITSVTYDNLPLTLAAKSTSRQAYNNMFSAIYYLADPPSGQRSIVVNRDYNVPLSVVAISLNNCDQINPIAAVNSGLVGGSHISLPIQATSAKAMLIDSVTFNYKPNVTEDPTDSNYRQEITEDTGQTSVYKHSLRGQTNELSFGDSYKAISTPGDYEMGWSTTGQYGAAYTVILVKGRGN